MRMGRRALVLAVLVSLWQIPALLQADDRGTQAAGAPGAADAPQGGRGGGARGQAGPPQPPAVVVPSGTPNIVLWPSGAPGSEARRNEPEQIRGETILNVHNPSMFAFVPERASHTGAALILAPGGGHSSLWIMHEGFNPAEALVSRGVATGETVARTGHLMLATGSDRQSATSSRPPPFARSPQCAQFRLSGSRRPVSRLRR